MDQWALFTSSQFQDLLTFSANSNLEIPLRKRLALFSDIDFNLIHQINAKETELYPLYNAGLQVNYAQRLFFRFSLTNKQMNLDQFFQTFYASTRPLFSYNISYRLDRVKLGSKKVKV